MKNFNLIGEWSSENFVLKKTNYEDENSLK